MKIKTTKRSNGSIRVQIICEGKGKTEQSHKNQVDINKIMAKVEKGGMPPLAKGSPMYGDFTQASDYQNALERLHAAQEQFDELPAKIRKRFDNDPAWLIDFMNNPENAAEARELGLITENDDMTAKTEIAPPAKAEDPPAASNEANPTTDG